MRTSSVKDSLELILSDEYKVSGGAYNELSDILVNNNLSEIAFDGGLVQIIKLLYKTKKTLPMSLTLIQQMWGSEYLSFDFKKMLIPLVKSGVIKLRKVDREKFESDDIAKTDGDLVVEQDKYIVVYGSGVFTKVYRTFEKVLDASKPTGAIVESVNHSVPSKINAIAERANKALKNISVNVSVESYMQDSGSKEEDINFIVSNVSNYKIADNEIQKYATRFIKRANYVKSVEAYKENKSEVYVGISVTADADYRDMATRLVNLVTELEIYGMDNTEEKR